MSDWKGTERLVAKALGGKRRLRTMESFALKVPDIYWPRKMRHKYPILRHVVVEVKKRKAMNVHAFFAEATFKYGKEGKNIVILASKIPLKGNLKSRIKKLKRKFEKQYEKKMEVASQKLSSKKLTKFEARLKKKHDSRISKAKQKLRARHDITALVTVDLEFFKELWNCWLEKKGKHYD